MSQSRSWLGERRSLRRRDYYFSADTTHGGKELFHREDTAMNTKDRVLASLIRNGVASSTRVTRRADETPRVRKERWRGDAKYALHSFSSPSSNVSLPARLAFSCVPSSVKFRNFPWPLKNTCALALFRKRRLSGGNSCLSLTRAPRNFCSGSGELFWRGCSPRHDLDETCSEESYD